MNDENDIEECPDVELDQFYDQLLENNLDEEVTDDEIQDFADIFAEMRNDSESN